VFGEDINFIGTYWPVLIIAVGLWMWWTQGFRADLAPVLVVLVGTFLLIDQVTDLNIWRLWPVLIIVAGAWLLYRRAAPVSPRAATESGGTVNISAIVGGGDSRFAAEEFRGGQVTAVFGGGKLDLSDATLPAEGATVDVTVLFGGYEFRVPPEWRVDMRATTLFGGSSDDRKAAVPSSGPLLTITGTVLFGGLEIKS
jgi:predicted membrane protein